MTKLNRHRRLLRRCFVFVLIMLGACTTLPDSAQVRIVRDDYGVPHIYADDVYGLYYGYGYSIAQDRLFQMEMARRSTQGTVAEVLGSAYLDYDKNTRTLFDPASIQRQLDALAQEDLDVFAGYAAGINAWLEKIEQSPARLTPKQYIDLKFQPTYWSAYDVAMIFIGTMNNRFGDYNTELENSAILGALVNQHGDESGRQLFDLLNPRFTSGAPTTIPIEDWSRPASDSLAATASKSELMPTVANNVLSPVISGFSNCYVLGRDKLVDGGSVLVNGPQFGWFNPSYVYSVGLHGAGIDVVGNTPFGYPMVMFGHNKTISWGSTWGASDIVDLFAEQLNAQNPQQYLYKGQYVDLIHRVERINVRGTNPVDHDVYRSVHGPVVRIDSTAGIAYAKKRSWDGGELETLLAWLYATWASDFDAWKAEAEKSAINVNMYFADVEGNIGYFHGGHFPERVAGHDNRFPVTGDGSMDWRERQSINTANPHVINPTSGYLANWNNKPGDGVMNPDFFFYSWSTADRVDYLHNTLSGQEKFTPEEAWEIIEKSSYADINANYWLPVIDQSVGDSDDALLTEANKILQRWNGESRDNDADGYYDEAGTAIFRTFVDHLIERVLSDDLGDAYTYFQGSGYPTAAASTASGTNIPPALKAIHEAVVSKTDYVATNTTPKATFNIFNGESVADVIEASLQGALSSYGVSDELMLAELRLPVANRPYSFQNFLGIPQAAESEQLATPIEQNRGTENNMIVMQPNKIVAWEVTPPGQNGFVSPDGEKTEHYDDQLEMYHQFEKKRVWFYPEDVEANKKSVTMLSY